MTSSLGAPLHRLRVGEVELDRVAVRVDAHRAEQGGQQRRAGWTRGVGGRRPDERRCRRLPGDAVELRRRGRGGRAGVGGRDVGRLLLALGLASSSLVSGGLPPEEAADACWAMDRRTASSHAVMCCEYALCAASSFPARTLSADAASCIAFAALTRSPCSCAPSLCQTPGPVGDSVHRALQAGRLLGEPVAEPGQPVRGLAQRGRVAVRQLERSVGSDRHATSRGSTGGWFFAGGGGGGGAEGIAVASAC